MFGIFAKTFMTATRSTTDAGAQAPRHRAEALPKLSWLDEDLPFRHHATRRSGRDD